MAKCGACGLPLDDIDAPCLRCMPCFYGHDYETGTDGWGVVIGVSRCKNCGKLAGRAIAPTRASLDAAETEEGR